MSIGDIGGVAAFVVAVLGAFGALWGVIKAANTKSRQDALVLKQSEYQVLFDELKTQLKTALGQIQQKQDFINELYDMQSDCEIDHASLYEFAKGLHMTVKRLASIIITSGGHHEELPELPARRERKIKRAEYIVRHTEQNTKISEATVTQAIDNPSTSSNHLTTNKAKTTK